MLLYITIGVLFAYTLLLIVFFMGWCTLFPNKCHPRKSIPFSSVKSPRRNTKFIEVNSVSSSHSAESLKHILPPRKFSRSFKKHSLAAPPPEKPKQRSDYLHPKYSLPPVTIDAATRWEFEQIMKTKMATPTIGDRHIGFDSKDSLLMEQPQHLTTFGKNALNSGICKV